MSLSHVESSVSHYREIPNSIICRTGNPVYSAPYKTEPKTREFEKSETDRIPDMKVTEPAETEWAASIVFAPNNDGSLRFCGL